MLLVTLSMGLLVGIAAAARSAALAGVDPLQIVIFAASAIITRREARLAKQRGDRKSSHAASPAAEIVVRE